MSDVAQITSLAGQFRTATTGWMGIAIGYASNLFGLLAVLEFVWSGVTYLLRKNDLPDFIASAFLKIVSLSFFYFVLLQGAPTYIPDIISSFMQMGATIGGVPQVSTTSPGTFVDQGIQMVVHLFNGLGKMGIEREIGAIFPTTLAAIFILISFVIIAAQLLIMLIESYIVLGAGAVMLGFMGSRWTSQWGEKYYGYAVSIGVKLMVIELIAGLGINLATTWDAYLAGASGVHLTHDFDIAMGSLLLAALAMMVPTLAGSFMSGSPSMSLGNVGGAAAAIGGGVVAAGAGAAMGGASLANSAIGAGKAVGALGTSANSTMGGMKGLGAAFTEGAGAAGESGILGLGGPGASKGSQTAAKAVGGLSGIVSQAGKGMATAGQHGASALKGMAKDRFHGRSGPGANDIAQNLGDKAVQGHGTGTSGGNLANRVREQHASAPEKGNSVGLGAAPDTSASPAGQRLGGSGPDGGSSAQMGRQDTGTGNDSGRNDAGSSQSTASQSGGSTNSAPGGNTSANPASTPGGDSIGGGGGQSRGGFTQTEGARFDQRTNHEKRMDGLQKIKEKYEPRGLPNDGGGGGVGGPNIRHTE
ncbi:MAG: P-type conjugative transfer protein TrbL [Acidithiobacillus sp.]